MLCTLNAMAQQSPRNPVNAEPDKYNQKVISRYNRCNKSPNLYPEKELAKDFTAIFWVNENSVMSTTDIEVNILKKRIDNPLYSDK